MQDDLADGIGRVCKSPVKHEAPPASVSHRYQGGSPRSFLATKALGIASPYFRMESGTAVRDQRSHPLSGVSGCATDSADYAGRRQFRRRLRHGWHAENLPGGLSPSPVRTATHAGPEPTLSGVPGVALNFREQDCDHRSYTRLPRCVRASRCGLAGALGPAPGWAARKRRSSWMFVLR